MADLPPPSDFCPEDFARLAQYAAEQHSSNSSPYQVAPVVAAYATSKQRIDAISGALPEDRAQYQAGVVVGSATRFFPAKRGGVGMVTSPLQGAAEASATSGNDWHTVGLLRRGASIWIYDPAYRMGSQSRLPNIPGTSNVTRLLGSTGFGAVTHVQVQGCGSEAQDCMGRAARWVDRVIGAAGTPNPYPEGTFVEGEATPGWDAVARF